MCGICDVYIKNPYKSGDIVHTHNDGEIHIIEPIPDKDKLPYLKVSCAFCGKCITWSDKAYRVVILGKSHFDIPFTTNRFFGSYYSSQIERTWEWEEEE